MMIEKIYQATLSVKLVPQTLTQIDDNILNFFDIQEIKIEKKVKIEFNKTDFKEPEIEGNFIELKISDTNSDKNFSITVPENDILSFLESENKKILIENLNCIDGISLFPNYECGSLELILD